MPARESRIRLFESRWVERLTLTPLGVFLAVWAAVIAALAWRSGADALGWRGFGLLLLGVAIWSLFEYAMHRWLFHWEPRRAPLAHLVFLMHGNHHAAPNDRLRNLMPPAVSLPLAALIWGLFVLVGGAAGDVAFLGFIIGYVAYDVVHYACHQWPMKRRLGQMLKRHHMRHHFLHAPGNFAVTGIMWDWLFRSRLGAR